MTSHRILKFLKIVILGIAAVFVFSFATMYLWNRLMPAVFGLRTITWLQALGLLVLGKLLFGGFHHHDRGCHRGWKRQIGERWAHMTPEERERFRAGMRGRRGCGFPPHSDPDPTSSPTSL